MVVTGMITKQWLEYSKKVLFDYIYTHLKTNLDKDSIISKIIVNWPRENDLTDLRNIPDMCKYKALFLIHFTFDYLRFYP